MVENHHLLRGLLDAVETSPNITLVTGHALATQSFAPGLAKLTLANGEQLSCSLVIAADGGKSPLRQAAGIELVGWSYEQMGIVASFDHELPHGGRAEEHFTPAGPFAVLPLPGNRSSIVWTKGTAEAKRLLGLSPQDFETELQNEIGSHLGKIVLLGKPQGYPLSMFFAKEFHATRLALVGDAAHVIHPLAGLGLNLGLRDAAALAECVADAHALGQDIGGLAVLERYSTWRRFDTVATAAGMDGLNRLFSNDNSFLRILRDLGLRATNQMPGVKQMFAREAAGQTGSLPRLLRGESGLAPALSCLGEFFQIGGPDRVALAAELGQIVPGEQARRMAITENNPHRIGADGFKLGHGDGSLAEDELFLSRDRGPSLQRWDFRRGDIPHRDQKIRPYQSEC